MDYDVKRQLHEQEKLKPSYYKVDGGRDLFDLFELGLMTREQTIGFYLGNLYKYSKRCDGKNGKEDMKKAQVYLDRLLKFKYGNGD